MIEYIQLEICYIQEYFFLFLLICSALHVKATRYMKHFLPFLPTTLIGVTLEILLHDSPIAIITSLFFTAVFFQLVFRKKIWTTTLLISLAMSIAFLIELLLVAVLPLNEQQYGQFFIQFLANSCVIIISALIYFFVPVHKLFSTIERASKFVSILIIDLFFILEMVNLFYRFYLTDLMTVAVVLMLMFSILIAIDWLILLDQAKLKHQQEQLLAYHNYLPMVEQLIEQVRTRQHEYDNILQAMRSLPFTCLDYPSLVSALGTYANDFQRDPQHSSLLKINLKLVAGFLYNKLHEIECKDKHIYIDIRQHVLPTNVPEFVLVEVLGIMIDNMVEASSPDDTPTLILDVEVDHLVITTRNYGPELNSELRKKFFTKGYSTKPEESKKRGYGLPRLLEIINESNGKLYLDNATEPLTRKTLVIFTAKI